MALSPRLSFAMSIKRSLKFIIILLLITFFLFPVYSLEVKVDKTERLVYQQLAKLNETFDVVWTHSVTLQPVIETYRLEGLGKIPIIRMVFDDYGPNLPAHPEFNQKWIIDEDGTVNVVNYDRVFERVPVTIGAVIANHALVYRGKTTYLKDVFRPGGYVHIGLEKDNLANYIFKEVEIWLKKN